MAVVVLASAGHAPGVTTTALGLALTWPRSALLVDADRTPTQAVLAGYLRGAHPGQHGLGRLLQAAREQRPLAEVVDAELLELPPVPATGRAARFLPGFPHPGVVGLFGATWPDLMAVLAARPGDVLIDAGRIGAEGLPAGRKSRRSPRSDVTGAGAGNTRKKRRKYTGQRYWNSSRSSCLATR